VGRAHHFSEECGENVQEEACLPRAADSPSLIRKVRFHKTGQMGWEYGLEHRYRVMGKAFCDELMHLCPSTPHHIVPENPKNSAGGGEGLRGQNAGKGRTTSARGK
jgi:hypothetical protein